MENVTDNNKSDSTDCLASCIVHDAPIMDRVTETPVKSTPTVSTSKEVMKQSSKGDCKKQGLSMSINPGKFYKVDGILLEDDDGKNYPY